MKGATREKAIRAGSGTGHFWGWGGCLPGGSSVGELRVGNRAPIHAHHGGPEARGGGG